MDDTNKPPVFDTLIPQEFKDKPYLADLKALPVGPEAYTALFKKFDGAQTLIGKKTGIPEANATPEEVEKFYGSLRPAKVEDYELPAPKEGAATPDPEAVKSVKGMFHEAGLSKAQASKLMAKFDAFIQEKTGEQTAAAARLDAEFAELTKKTFGPENEKVLLRSKELLNSLTPPEMAPFLNRLPNESLVLVAGLMESVRAKFMKEDNLSGAGGGTAVDVVSLNDEGKKLMQTAEWKDAFNPGHAAMVAKVNGLYDAIAKASSGKK